MSALMSILLFTILVSPIALFAQSTDDKSIAPFIKALPNGTMVRDNESIPTDYIPPQSTPDPTTKVVSKDITLDSAKNITARIYLPSLTDSSSKLPILVYFHGGAFCIGSAFASKDHLYLNKVTSESNVVAISVNYRLFPEFAFPTAFEDGWFALQWVVSQEKLGSSAEPWLVSHGDFSKIFLGGDSSGATIVHNLSMRASEEALPDNARIYGAFLAMPYFLGSSVPVPLEPSNFTGAPLYTIWKYVCSNCPYGYDNPAINPEGPRSPSLRRLSVQKIMVYTAENDQLRGRGVRYVAAIRASKWSGTLSHFEGKNVVHVFHVMDLENPESVLLIQRLAQFLNPKSRSEL